MRIGSAEDAESVVRKYFLGTRTSHGKIVSMSAEEKTEGPERQWYMEGQRRISYRGRRQSTLHSDCLVTRRSTDNQLKLNQTENAAEEAQH